MDALLIYEKIKATVMASLPESRVVLFGSRARGDHDKHSDYDLLIITSQTFGPKEKINWSTLLDKAITKAINAPIDIILSSEAEVLQNRSLPGHIIKTAMREGFVL